MDELKSAASRAKIEVIPVGEDLIDRIYGCLNPELQMVELPRRDVLERVINVVRTRDTRTVVVERDYVDADYLETYAQHYSKAFREKTSHCMRLHFFAADLSLEDVFHITRPQARDYLGFCVFRPTGHQYISRTVLAPPHTDDDQRYFVPANARFSAHLAGQKLVVSGAPFIQQDANTFICAGAAMWVLALFMHARHSAPRYFPAQIAGLARERFSHGELRSGITVDQIVMTLQRIGLNPHVERCEDLQRLKHNHPDAHRKLLVRLVDFLHVFVDSGLPPVLAYATGPGTGHAVTVVGHDIAKRGRVPSEILSDFRGVVRNSHFVDTFFVMDDGRGPYAPFSAFSTDDPTVPCLADCDSVYVIAPMPVEANLNHEDAFDELAKLVSFWNVLLSNLTQELEPTDSGPYITWADHALNFTRENPLVARTALLDSRDWKLQVLDSTLPGWLKLRYQALLLPKFVWVIEISDFKNVNHADRDERRILGEAVLDATANPHCPFDSLLTFHANGLLMEGPFAEQRDEQRMDFVCSDEPFEAYSPVLRSI